MKEERIKVKVTGAKPRADVVVELRSGAKKIATLKGRTDAAGSVTLTVKPAKKDLKKLAKAKALTVRTTVTEIAGAKRTAAATVKVK